MHTLRIWRLARRGDGWDPKKDDCGSQLVTLGHGEARQSTLLRLELSPCRAVVVQLFRTEPAGAVEWEWETDGTRLVKSDSIFATNVSGVVRGPG